MFFNKTIDEVLEELETNPITGLSQKAAELQREKFGLNQLASKKPKTLIAMFFAQLNKYFNLHFNCSGSDICTTW